MNIFFIKKHIFACHSKKMRTFVKSFNEDKHRSITHKLLKNKNIWQK